MLLVFSLGMGCAATNEASVGTASLDTVSVSTPSAAFELPGNETRDIAGMNSSSQESSVNIEIPRRIALEGCEQIQLPRMDPVLRVGLTSRDLLISEGLAVYSQGLPIQGRIDLSRERDDLAIANGSDIQVCIAPLSLKGYLAGDPGELKPSGDTICTEAGVGNGRDTDSAEKRANLSFSISADRMAGRRSGLYAVYAIDGNRSTIAPAQAFFLTEGEAILQLEDSINPENSSIKINLSTGSEKERKRLFAAAIMPRKEYENTTIRLVANESNPWPVLALSSSTRSIEIVANPATAYKQLMDMISLLPEDSAISMQESAQSSVTLVLLADGPWKKGEYMINCAIYSPAVGVEGLKQSIVEVV